MGRVRAGLGWLCVGLCGCSLLVGSPDATYDAGMDAAGYPVTEQDADKPRAIETARDAATDAATDGASDASEVVQCDGAACTDTDATVDCVDGGCDPPDAGSCPLSQNPCVVRRWNQTAERCDQETLGDCTPCGADGLCAGGECFARGVLYLEDFEDGELGDEWASPGPAPWRFATDQAHVGSRSLSSGPISHRERSSVTLTLDDVSPRAMLRFWYRVDSETNYDTFDFQVGDAYQATFGEPREWEVLEFPLAPGGDMKMTWIYVKDGANSVGADRAWLDEVSVYLVCGANESEGE